mgnify:CR=1 FL=1
MTSEIKATVSNRIKGILQELVRQDIFSSESDAVGYLVRRQIERLWSKGIKLSQDLGEETTNIKKKQI